MLFKLIITVLSIITSTFVINITAFASPYGAGLYGENVPYGGQTNLTISNGGNVSIAVNPTVAGVLGKASGTVTVTSTDVVGYKLYASSVGSTNMSNGGTVLPASANGSQAPLATNTWGYNLDASSNFIGMTTSNALLLSFTGPAKLGNTTTVTYGAMIDLTKKAGTYSTNVLYTAVPQTN